MLRYSLYKKFGTGGIDDIPNKGISTPTNNLVSPQVEQITNEGNLNIPTAEELNAVLQKDFAQRNSNTLGKPFAPKGSYRSSLMPEGTITSEGTTYEPGTFNDASKTLNFLYSSTGTKANEGQTDPEDAKNIEPNYLPTLGLLGVDSAFAYNQDLKNQRTVNQSIQQRNSKPLYDYDYMYGRTSSGGTGRKNVITAEMGAEIKKRYSSGGGNNVEIEGGEFIQLPNFQTEMATGPSHERGGIPTNLPDETRVYSNSLKPEGSKKTFAQLAKNYDITSYKKTMDNPFAKQVDKDTAGIMMQRNQKILDSLFNDQQALNGNSNGELMSRNGASINNAGFRALPQSVQDKILAEMQYGGNVQEAQTLQMGDGGGGVKYKVPAGVTIKKQGDPSIQVGDYVMGENNRPMKVTAANKKTTIGDYNKNFDELSSTFNRPEFAKVKDAMYAKYKQRSPNSPMTKDQFMDNFMNAQKQFYTIKEAAKNDPNLDIKTEDLDRTSGGMKNKIYNQIATKLGMTPLTDEQGTNFQQSYLDLADLKDNPEFKDVLADVDLTPQGVYDDMYKGKAISKADGIIGNTTIGEMLRLKSRNDGMDYQYENAPIDPGEVTFNQSGTAPRGQYTAGKFPLYQAIPELMGLAQAQEKYAYAIPEVDSPYLRPQTYNTRSQMQNVDNSGTAAVRAGADPLDVYIAGLDAKQKISETGENYDMQSRANTDQANAQMKFQADQINLGAFDKVYNNQMAQASDAQSAEKQAAIANLINKKAYFDQSESRKAAFINNLVPSFNTTSQGQMGVVDGQLPFYFNQFNDYVDGTTSKEKKTAKKGMYKKSKY